MISAISKLCLLAGRMPVYDLSHLTTVSTAFVVFNCLSVLVDRFCPELLSMLLLRIFEPDRLNMSVKRSFKFVLLVLYSMLATLTSESDP